MSAIIENLSALLIEVRNNPELNAIVLQQCEDLYSELFVAASTIQTGTQILELNKFNSEIEDELCRQLFSHELNKIHSIERAKELLESAPIEEPEYEDNNDWDPNDEYSNSYGFHYDENAYAEWDESAYLQNKSRLIEALSTTKFAELVNYKGECEGECIIDEDSHYRMFHGKYDYS